MKAAEKAKDYRISLPQQIDCVVRQIRILKTVLPQWAAQRKITPADARLHLEGMEAVQQTLENLVKRSQ